MFLHLLNISLPFHSVSLSVFEVCFLQAEGSYFLLMVESALCGWCWSMPCEGLRFWRTCVCVLVDGAGPYLSGGSAMSSSDFQVSVDLVWLWAACLLMFKFVFQFC